MGRVITQTRSPAFQIRDKLFKLSAELLKAYKEIESSAECLKSSVAYLCYNMTHAVPISHGKFSFTIRL